MGRATATVNGKTVATADSWESVEGNVYFPPSSMSDMSIFSDSSLSTKCPWKGTSTYHNVTVDGEVVENVAWSYAQPKDAAKNIKDHFAFDKKKAKVEIQD